MDEPVGLEDSTLKGGIWSGLLRQDQRPGNVAIVHTGLRVGEGRVSPAGEGLWRVEAALPAGRLSDGVQTFLMVLDEPGAKEITPAAQPVARLTIVAGRPLDADVRAEIDLLRAELDLLKRELRRFAAG